MRRVHFALTVLLLGVWFLGACASPVTLEPPPTPAGAEEPVGELPPADEATEPAQPTPTATSVPLAATVNGEPITLEAYERQMARYEVAMMASGEDTATAEGQESLAEARDWVLDRLIEQRLIAQAAEAQGVSVSDEEVEVEVQSLVQDIGQEEFDERLANEGLTLAELKAELKQEMLASRMVKRVVSDVPTVAEHVNARHIVVSTEEEAQQILTQLEAGADFARLAQTYSQDAYTRDQGGDLGFFPRGVLTSQEVEDVAFALDPGQVSEVVQSNLGYHIVKVVERVGEMEVSPDNLRLLRASKVNRWLEDLWGQATIERFVTPVP
jgi:parvulin-like peptidyl-prolyl isomerase